MWVLFILALAAIIWLLWTIAQNTGDTLDHQAALHNEIVRLNNQLEKTAGEQAPTSKAMTTGKININKDEVETLTQLPGIGQAMAERIVAARPYSSIDELIKVQGINDDLIKKIRSSITAS